MLFHSFSLGPLAKHPCSGLAEWFQARRGDFHFSSDCIWASSPCVLSAGGLVAMGFVMGLLPSFLLVCRCSAHVAGSKAVGLIRHSWACDICLKLLVKATA